MNLYLLSNVIKIFVWCIYAYTYMKKTLLLFFHMRSQVCMEAGLKRKIVSGYEVRKVEVLNPDERKIA